MAWNYRKRIKIAPGIHLNLSKNGVSTSIGPNGARVTFGKNGTYLIKASQVQGYTPERNCLLEASLPTADVQPFFWQYLY